MPRFIPTRSGAGIPAIQDTAKKRIAAAFFVDKDAPDAADAMLKIGTASGGRGSTLPPEALPFILSRLSSADCPPGGRCP